jgi:hypothetical protein
MVLIVMSESQSFQFVILNVGKIFKINLCTLTYLTIYLQIPKVIVTCETNFVHKTLKILKYQI